VRNNFRKEDTLKILFSDEKMFDIDGIYNAQNDRIWAVNREEADKKGGVWQKRKFPQKVMVWLGACSKGLTPLIILDKGTVDHQRYINQVLPVALKYGNKVFGNEWTFQQDGANPLLGIREFAGLTVGTPYTVTEVAAPGYQPTYSGQCTNLTLALGQTADCYITNNDIPAGLATNSELCQFDYNSTTAGNQFLLNFKKDGGKYALQAYSELKYIGWTS